MATFGTKLVNVHTVDRDEVVYSGADNSVSVVDTLTLRRAVGKTRSTPLRTNARFERSISTGVDTDPKSVTVSIAITVPPGVSEADARAYIASACTDAAAAAPDLAFTGDIHL